MRLRYTEYIGCTKRSLVNTLIHKISDVFGQHRKKCVHLVNDICTECRA